MGAKASACPRTRSRDSRARSRDAIFRRSSRATGRERAGDGCSKVFLDKRDRRRLEAYAGPLNRQLEPFMDIYLVVSPHDQVITAAHRIDKIKRC